jgi:hypothetical protein
MPLYLQVPVTFSPSTSLPKSCRLVLMSRRDTGSSAASAATLVFLLKGQADVKTPLKQVNVAAPLYQLTTQEFAVTNPFPAGMPRKAFSESAPHTAQSNCLDKWRIGI